MTREEAKEYLVPINEEFKKLGFNRQLTTAIETLISNPWHKVSKELPKEGAFLVCKMGKQPVYKTLEYSSERDGFWTSSGGFITRNGVREYFTHWMPIPELPKEK